jgi:hypothetical protein
VTLLSPSQTAAPYGLAPAAHYAPSVAPEHQDPPYLKSQQEARACVEAYMRALEEVEARRVAIPPAVRRYYLDAVDHLPGTHMAAAIGLGESTFRAQTADLAAQRRAEQRARRRAQPKQ